MPLLFLHLVNHQQGECSSLSGLERILTASGHVKKKRSHGRDSSSSSDVSSLSSCQWYEGPKLRDFLLGCEPEKTTLQAEVVREIMNLTHDYFPSRGWRGEMLYSPVYRFQSQEGIIRPLVENQRRPTAD
ncbi:uncharacterized protein [Branchiostoma lanceolatum]|uniref:uncharacterized protein isoform X3 n=1 Tax=Branchiostoma lanceolatum TaxID=7740 RepID=UPI0034542EB0